MDEIKELELMEQMEDEVQEQKSLDEEVLDYYELTELPFSLVPHPRFLYHTQAHLQAFNRARSNITQRQGLTVILGDLGTGKSTVSRKLYLDFKRRSQSSNYDIRLIKNASNWTTTSKMIRSISTEFGCELRRSEEAQWAEFESFAMKRATDDKVDIVLLIDEAQEVPRKVLIRLRELLNLETISTKIVQIVLFGTLDLWDKLTTDKALRPLMSRIAGGPAFLTPLDREDLSKAIKFRLTVAGRTESLFDEECFDIIHLASGGVLRNAVDICRLALQHGFEAGEQIISPVSVKMAARSLIMTKVNQSGAVPAKKRQAATAASD
jgi:general secretion pathway protein A